MNFYNADDNNNYNINKNINNNYNTYILFF